MNAQHIVYGKRITGDRRRWCAICGTQRPTEHGKFIAHQRPNAKPGDKDCPNSGQRIAKVEAVG